jgi:hypothetical protein
MYTTGNPDRDRLLRAAVQKVLDAGKTPTLKFVTGNLPGDFQLDQEELDGMLPNPDAPPNEITLEAAQPAIPETAVSVTAVEAAQPEPPSGTAVETTQASEINEQQARTILDAANKRLSNARSAMVIAQETLKYKRGDLATAIYGWQQIGQPQQQSFENLIRDEIRKNQEYKQAVAEGRAPPPVRRGPRGRSFIDQTNGFYGNGNDFARRTNLATAGTAGQPVSKGYKRGAYSQKEAVQIEAQKLRAAAQARKLPSER